MIYIDRKTASGLFGVADRAIGMAITRGSDKYRHITIEGRGRGGKKLLIGVEESALSEAIHAGTVGDDVATYDEAGLACAFEHKTIILNSKEEKQTAPVVVPDMNEYLNATPQQRESALLRMAVIEGCENREKRVSISEYLEGLDEGFEAIKPSEPKLFRWKKAVQRAREKGESPLVALLDKRGTKKGATKLSAEQQEMAVRMLCRRDNPLRVSAIYQNMLHAYGEQMPSYDVLNNFLNAWKIKNASLVQFAQDADGWKNSRLAAFGSLSEKAKYPNHYWELDSTPADVVAKDGKRYAVLCAIDVYSRRCVFWVDERSSSFSIARLMRKAMLKLGIPEHVVIDNGKDYKSNHFASICYNLGIKQETVPPFSGDMKPHVERIFRTLSGELFEELEGFVGHSVGERQKIEGRRGFAHKIQSKAKWYEDARREEKRTFREGFKIRKENLGLELQIPIEAEQLQTWIDTWTENIYERRSHGSLGMTPLAKWQKTFMPVKAVPDPRMLDILLGESHTRKVSKKGIRLDGALYQHVKLAPYVGEQVRLLSDDDMGRVFVYQINYVPICIAEDYEYTGKSRAELAEGKRFSNRIAREMAKLLEEWEEASRKMDPSIKDRIEASVLEKGRELRVPTPAIAKSTEATRAVMEGSKVFAAQDEAAAKASNIMTMSGEKLLPSGRPVFTSYFDRMVWDILNDRVDETTEKIFEKYPDMKPLAEKEAQRQKKIG